jgi:trk system potassium uptake protein TrkA
MKVIICGAGQVGVGIAERLAGEGNAVTMIEPREDLVQRVNDTLDVRAIKGHGAHPDVLDKAGAADADMLIAVTLHDEVNMVACQVAHSLFDVPTKIARVRSQAYLTGENARLFGRANMAIDAIISPEVEVAKSVLRRLEVPGAFETINFAEGRVLLLGMNCGATCPVVDTPVEQLTALFPDLPAVIAAVVRNGSLFVPTHEDMLLVGDDVYVIADAAQVSRILKIFGHEEPQARRIVIAGGGNIGLFVARELETKSSALRLKVIEASRARAVEIADRLDRTVVLHGSALSEDIMREAEVPSADAFVALTNDDQANILTSVLAKQLGCRASLCLVNSPNYNTMVRSLGLDAEINPRAVTVSRILQFVRRGRIRGVHSIHNGAGEVLEAEVLDTAAAIGKPLKVLGLSKGIRFGAVLRGGKLIQPRADTELMAKDRVVLFSRADRVREVEQMFRVTPDYF